MTVFSELLIPAGETLLQDTGSDSTAVPDEKKLSVK